MISEVQPSDAGKYECSAQSMAGIRTAPPAMLKVLAPPTVLRGPQDTEVIEGDGLDLPCEVRFLQLNAFSGKIIYFGNFLFKKNLDSWRSHTGRGMAT